MRHGVGHTALSVYFQTNNTYRLEALIIRLSLNKVFCFNSFLMFLFLLKQRRLNAGLFFYSPTPCLSHAGECLIVIGQDQETLIKQTSPGLMLDMNSDWFLTGVD